MKKNNLQSGIVLLAKQPGRTSFSSLSAVKKALCTTKAGHTGTLDSFAQGLLVVCTGSLTRLAQKVTGFNKTYQAVIEFGKETATLDPEGEIVKTCALPSLQALETSLKKFTGTFDQVPPVFSAIHVDGVRSSDAVRKGQAVLLPPRRITVFSSKLLEVSMENEGVKYARVEFEVSKGTYIRALARDIGLDCSSCAYLAGLLRTKVGRFDLKDAAGFDLLKEFTVQNVLEENAFLAANGPQETRQIIMEEIPSHLQPMTKDFADYCGFGVLNLKRNSEKEYFNGRPLKFNMFDCSAQFFSQTNAFAVFTFDSVFCGMIENINGKLCYQFVIPHTDIDVIRKNLLGGDVNESLLLG